MGGVLIIVGIMAVILLISGFTTPKRNQKLYKAYTKLGSRLGLEIQNEPETGFFASPFYPSLAGKIGPMAIVLDTFKTGSGKSTRYWSELKVFTGYTGNETFKISASNVFKRIGTALGGQDVEVGDEEFDKYFIVKSSDERMASFLLTPEIQSKLLMAWKNNYVKGSARLEEGILIFRDESINITTYKETSLARMMDVFINLGNSIHDFNVQSGFNEQSSSQSESNEDIFG